MVEMTGSCTPQKPTSRFPFSAPISDYDEPKALTDTICCACAVKSPLINVNRERENSFHLPEIKITHFASLSFFFYNYIVTLLIILFFFCQIGFSAMSVEASSNSVVGVDGKSGPSTKKKSGKPKYSRFTQQELHAWQPILTPGMAIAIFTVVGVIFIPLGFASLSASKHVVEVTFRYDNQCLPPVYSDNAVAYIQNDKLNKTCTTKWIVQRHMKAPVYVYYQLDNYYQNHRRYVKSKSDNQLRSRKAERDVSLCSPENYTPNDKGHQPIVPCGLIAWSLFNDTYRLSTKNKDLVINRKNIAWKSDQRMKFGSDVYPKNFQAGGLIGGARLNESIPLSEQEDLIVWMRTAALPTFRKLYGKIEAVLKVNDEIILAIENNYNTYQFGGKKSLVLSTTTWIGGRNHFLGMANLLIGGFSMLLAIGFLLLYIMKPRPLADPSYLSWNKNTGDFG